MTEHDTIRYRRSIGRRISRARRARRVALPELAARACLRPRQLQAVEAGRRSISVDQLELIASMLHLPLGHFIDGCTLCGATPDAITSPESGR